MRNTTEFIASASGTGIAAVGTALQTDQVLMYISLAITIVGGIITLITGVIGLIARIKEWHKKAMEDGKITPDEYERLGGILKEGYDDAKQSVDNIKEATKKGKKNGLH